MSVKSLICTGYPDFIIIHCTLHVCTRIRIDGIKAMSRVISGQTSYKIYQYELTRSSLFILLKWDNYFFDAKFTVQVLTSANYLGTGHFQCLVIERYDTLVINPVPLFTIRDIVQESLQRIADYCCEWLLRTKVSWQILMYGIWECSHHTTNLKFSSLMIWWCGDSMLFQSWLGETGQLMGIATRTLAWELFVRSKNLWCVHNKSLEYACPFCNPQQAPFRHTRRRQT